MVVNISEPLLSPTKRPCRGRKIPPYIFTSIGPCLADVGLPTMVILILQVDRGVNSPADISMDITKLIQTLDTSPTSFKEGVRLILENQGSS